MYGNELLTTELVSDVNGTAKEGRRVRYEHAGWAFRGSIHDLSNVRHSLLFSINAILLSAAVCHAHCLMRADTFRQGQSHVVTPTSVKPIRPKTLQAAANTTL